jgi:hypothetical protein
MWFCLQCTYQLHPSPSSPQYSLTPISQGFSEGLTEQWSSWGGGRGDMKGRTVLHPSPLGSAQDRIHSLQGFCHLAMNSTES